MTFRLPYYKESKPFEEFCCSLWKAMYPELAWDLRGRDGQGQGGRDVEGKKDGQLVHLVECKARDEFLGSTVTTALIDEIVAKLKKALGEGAKPRLSIATTAPGGANIQDHVLRVSQRAGFEIDYWSWDRIERELAEHPEVLEQHFAQFGFGGTPERLKAIAAYCRSMESDLDRLVGLDAVRDSEDVGARHRPGLAEVYTTVRVTHRIVGSGPARQSVESGWGLPHDSSELVDLLDALGRVPGESGESWRLATVLEAAAVNPRLAIGGYGGSGKSTFLRHLCLCLAGERQRLAGRPGGRLGLSDLRREGVELWRHGALLPVWIELRDFMRWFASCPSAHDATGERIWEYLKQRGSGAISQEMASELLEMACSQRHLSGILLAVDGLDEVPDRGAQVPKLLEILDDFLRHDDKKHCRVLITGRPHALNVPTVAKWLGRQRFAIVEMQSLDHDACWPVVEAFLRGWFSASEREELAREAIESLRDNATLRGILRTPLLLTMFADLFEVDGTRDWTSRFDLFEATTERLIDRWNAARGLEDARELAPQIEPIRRAVEALAWEVQSTSDVDPKDGHRYFDERLLKRHLEAYGVEASDTVQLYLAQRCGIIEPHSEHRFRFQHNLFREFLAAREAARHPSHPLNLLEHVRRSVADWREVLLFASARGGRLGHGVPAWHLLEHALPEGPGEGVARDDPQFELAHVCAEALFENGLVGAGGELRPNDRPKADRLRAWLARLLDLGALPLVQRAQAGRWLDGLGDPRPGVGLCADGLPDIDWVLVEWPEGGDFAMARHPVTNTQFDAFVVDGGYAGEHDDCWTAEGLRWLGGTQGPYEEEAHLGIGNHPRVHVSLHEAVAFAAWLGKRRDHLVFLPSERLWEWAARGPEQRVYPWLGEFDPQRCNSRYSGIRATCAVGMNLLGVSWCGAHDLAGNVWDWALTDADRAGERMGAIRGGAWPPGSDSLRSGVRIDLFADFRLFDLGFRVCAPASTVLGPRSLTVAGGPGAEPPARP